MELTFNWMAGLATVALVIGVIAIGQVIAFRIPAIAMTLEFNNAQNKDKWRSKGHKYQHRVKSSKKMSIRGSNAILPETPEY